MKTRRRRFVLTLVLLTLSISTLWAQSPEKMSYQFVVRNSSNQLVSNQAVGVKISIMQGSPEGAVVYSEVFNPAPQTNANGLLNLEVGSGTPLSGTFAAIDWSNGLYYLKTEADPSGGSSYSITGVSQLLSVPYALFAKTAESISGEIVETDPAVALNFDFTNAETGDLLQFNGTKWVIFSPNYLTSYTESQNLSNVLTIGNDGNAKQIKNIANPTAGQDAATKAYVDALIARIDALEETVLLIHGLKDTRDGNEYRVVKVGNRLVMAEDLRYLPEVHSNAEFVNRGNNSQPAYGVWGYNGSVVATAKANSNYSDYGVLYNWFAVMQGAASSAAVPSGVQGICPDGWHVPSYIELSNILYSIEGGTSANLGGKMKETGTTYWSSPNTGADNSSELSLRGSGSRSLTGAFENLRTYHFLSTTEQYYSQERYVFYTVHNAANLSAVNNSKKLGFSVRCVKDY